MLNSEAEFLRWFAHIYGREWHDIQNEEQDVESINARRGFEAGYLAGWLSR